MNVDLTVIPRTQLALRALGASGRPVIVGPWLSEIGFEVLYWVPWLRWALPFAGLRPDQVTIVSRGGPRSWYAGLGDRYCDVLDVYTPQAFRAGDARRMAEQADRSAALGYKPNHLSTKQHALTGFDEEILTVVRAAPGLADADVLHPSLLFGYFRPYWRHLAPRLYQQSTVTRRLSPPALPLDLPARYVAVKFYSSKALEAAPSHQQAVQAVVQSLVASDDVVLLHSGTQYDDHGEFPIDPHPRLHRVALPPSQNLDIQTAVIAGASRYVGTYGGFAYLAPFLGVPTTAFYGHENFRRDHRDLVALIARTALRVPFELRSVRHWIRRHGKALQHVA